LNNLKIINGFLVHPDAMTIDAFKELYIALRLKEGRVFNEKEIADLPATSPSFPHHKEWLLRSRSCNKLLKYIKKHGHIQDILEVGCGNGWLSAQLSAVAKGRVTGIDINLVELQQARKVFRHIPNLKFSEGDIITAIPEDEKFDLIVFAASVQYFKSLKQTLKIATHYLTLQGEIHIIDSRLYQPYEISQARERSKKYFTGLGFPEMAHFYFHHCIDEIKSFPYSILYNPDSGINKLFYKNPFYWIVIKNQQL
jgi:ubiquinone/menaquinone biosynthesis C-methylase UbiE